MINLKKKDLASILSVKMENSPQEAGLILDQVLGVFEEMLIEGNTIDLYGFGKFEVKEKAERPGINPLTKEKITIAASKSISFKPSKALKNKVNG